MKIEPTEIPSADSTLEGRRGDLRFVDPATEARYRDWRSDRAIPFTRVGMAGSFLAWALAIVGFWLALPDTGPQLAAFVAVVMTPIIAVAVAATYSPRHRAWVLPVTAAANAVAGLSLVCIWRWAFPAVEGAAAGIVIVMYFGFTIFRVPPAQAAVAVTTYFVAGVAHVADQWVVGVYGTPAFVLTLMSLTISFLTGLLVCVALERVSRQTFRHEQIIERQKREIERQRARADNLLKSILPVPIAERLKEGPTVIADRFESVTVLFADVVGFTSIAAKMPPERLVDILDQVFTRFDALAERFGIEKIKTIGDAYMAVAGVPAAQPDHAERAAKMAIAMRDEIEAYARENDHGIRLRIGLASGPAVAGVIGTRKFAYDLWGDTVNTAARMESHGVAGRVHVSESTRAALGNRWTFEERGQLEIKGKGLMATYVLVGPAGA